MPADPAWAALPARPQAAAEGPIPVVAHLRAVPYVFRGRRCRHECRPQPQLAHTAGFRISIFMTKKFLRQPFPRGPRPQPNVQFQLVRGAKNLRRPFYGDAPCSAPNKFWAAMLWRRARYDPRPQLKVKFQLRNMWNADFARLVSCSKKNFKRQAKHVHTMYSLFIGVKNFGGRTPFNLQGPLHGSWGLCVYVCVCKTQPPSKGSKKP